MECIVTDTTFDVSRYARLWRDHVVDATCRFSPGAGRCRYPLFFGVTHTIGRLDELETAFLAYIAGHPELDEANRQEVLGNVVEVFNLVRDGFEHRRASLAAVSTAAVFLLAAYFFGCGTFRIRVVTGSLAALLVVALECLLGIVTAAQMELETPHPKHRMETRPTTSMRTAFSSCLGSCSWSPSSCCW